MSQKIIQKSLSNLRLLFKHDDAVARFLFVHSVDAKTKVVQRLFYVFTPRKVGKTKKSKVASLGDIASINKELKKIDKTMTPFSKKSSYCVGSLRKRAQSKRLRCKLKKQKDCSLEKLKKGLKSLESSFGKYRFSKILVFTEEEQVQALRQTVEEEPIMAPQSQAERREKIY